MDWKNQLTKTPYLVLFIVLISIGVGTASALITITLSGDVIITGFLDMTGDKIANVGTPTESTDAATKAYVDSQATESATKTYTVTQTVTPAPGGGFATADLQCNTGDFMTGWFWDNTGSTALAADLRYITMSSILDVNENLIGGSITIKNVGANGGSIDLAIICLSK